MTDIASLGFQMDSGPLRATRSDMDALTAAAGRLQNSFAGARSAANSSAKSVAEVIQSVVQSTRAAQSQAEATMVQANAAKEAARATLAETQAIQSNVARKRELEASIQAVNTSTKALSLSRGRDAQLQEYQARLDKQEMENLRALTVAQNQAAAAAANFGSKAAQARAAQGVASARSADLSQAAYSARGGMTPSTGLTQHDLEANARAVDELRAKYVPLYAASKAYEAQLNEINALEAQGVLTKHQAAEANETLANTMLGAGAAAHKAQQGFGNAANSVSNLSFQINDIASGIAMGQSPFTILAQQGGQVFQVWQQNNNVFSDFGAVIKRVASPTVLAITAIVGAVAAVGYAFVTAINNAKGLETSLVGLGRASGVTASQLDEMAKTAAKASNQTISDARGWAEAFASSGKVSGDSIGKLTALVADYAATTHQTTEAGTKDLIGIFSNLSTGAQTLREKLGQLTPAQVAWVKALADSGQHNDAVRHAIDLVTGSVSKQADQLTALGRAMQYVKSQASQMVEGLIHSAVPTTQDNIDLAQAKLADYQRRGADPTQTAQLTNYIEKQKAALEKDKRAKRTLADNQSASDLADQARPFIQSGAFGDQAANAVTATMLTNLMNNKKALADLGIDYKFAKEQQEAYTNAVSSYISPAERAAKQTAVTHQSLVAKTAAQKGAAAAAQVSLDLEGQVMSAEARSAKIHDAYNQAYQATSRELSQLAQSQKIAVNGAIALGDAWNIGSNAAMDSAASTQALSEAVNGVVDVEERTRDLVLQNAAARQAAAAQGVDSLNMETNAQRAANDAVDDGVISYTQAAQYSQRLQQQRAQEILLNDAYVKSDEKLAASIRKTIADMKIANDNSDTEHTRATVQQITGDLEEQVKLAGMSADQRERESAVLSAIHATNGKISDVGKDSIRAYVQQRQEVERLQQVVDGVAGSFEDMFTTLFDKGKLSFGSLVDSIKSQFARLLAYMLTQSLLQPIIVPIVQSFAGIQGIPGGNLLSAGAGGITGGGGLLGTVANGASLGNSFGMFGSGGSLGGIGSTITSGFNSIGSALGFATPEVLLPGGEVLGGAGGGQLGSLFGSTTFGSFLGGAGLGSLASSLIFGNKNSAGIGGMGGAAAGALAGSLLFPGVGTIVGGLLGGLAGGGLGSISGTSNQGAIANFSGDGMSNYLFKQGGGQNGAMATQAANAVSTIISGLAKAGVTVSLGNVTGLSIGSDKSYVYGTNGMKEKLAGGEAGIAAVTASILSKILPGATGGDENTRTILGKYQSKGGITTENLDALVSDLNFAKSLANFDFGIKSLTQSQQLLKNISDQFQGAIDKANELGLDTSKLVEARNSAVQQVVSDYNDNISASLEQLTDPIKFAFDQLAKNQKQRIEDATGLGADLSQVYALNKAETDALVKQYGVVGDATGALVDKLETTAEAQSALSRAYNAEMNKLTSQLSKDMSALANAYNKQAGILNQTIQNWTGISQNLNTYLNGLGVQTAGNPAQGYGASNSLFNSTAAAAAGGDLGAAAKLTEVGNQLIAASAENSATNIEYQADIARVRMALTVVAAKADAQVTAAQLQLDQLNASVKGLGIIDEDVRSVADILSAIANDNSQITALNATVAGLGVLDDDLKSVQQAIEDLAAAQGRDAATAQAALSSSGLSSDAALAASYGAASTTGYDVSASSAAALASAGGGGPLPTSYSSIGNPTGYGVGITQADIDNAINLANAGDSDPAMQQYNSSRQWLQGIGYPGFASGGNHMGGWRIVGERGPEMENTGPSHITSTDQMQNIFDNSGVVAEVRALRSVVEQVLYKITDGFVLTKRIRDIFEAVTYKNGGNSITTNT